MVKGSIRTSLRPLTCEDIAKSICQPASEIARFCDNLQKHSLRKSLEDYGLPLPTTLDGWRFPDIIWNAICQKFPQLNSYPLGKVTERALKKTVITVMLNPHPRLGMPEDPSLSEKQVQQRLRLSTKALGTEKILKLFLAQWFFELSIRDLRGKRGDPRFDYSFGYHFSRDGYLVSLDFEKRLRERLLNQCRGIAEEFFPFLWKSLREKDFSKIDRRISQGLVQVFRVRPTKIKQKQGVSRPFLNVIVGTQSKAKLKTAYRIDKKVTRFVPHGKDLNVSFNFETLEDFLGHRVHSLVKDLLEVGIVIYMADLYAKREQNLARQVGILMPVRHPKIWAQAQTQLERTVSFLARDNISIQFVKRKEHRDELHDFSVIPNKRCVCLLSGGIDSAAGAVWAIEHGLTPIFVSHFAANALSGIQKSLIRRLTQIYGREFPHVSFHVTKSRKRKGRYRLGRPPGSILAQHLRSFLFLSLATAVALESKSSKVYIFENGPLALNPLFSEARINTRTVHPHFLEYFRTLIKTVFGVELVIENPFCYQTKGEVVSLLSSKKVQHLVPITNSCWNWFKVPVIAGQLGIRGFDGKHDGECFPCILRRVAIHHAGLWNKDAPYLIDIFNIFNIRIFDRFPDLGRDIVTGIADFVRFCQNVKVLSDNELLLRVPDFSVSVKETEPQELVAMYRRFAEEVLQCFQARSSDTFRKVFTSALEA